MDSPSKSDTDLSGIVLSQGLSDCQSGKDKEPGSVPTKVDADDLEAFALLAHPEHFPIALLRNINTPLDTNKPWAIGYPVGKDFTVPTNAVDDVILDGGEEEMRLLTFLESQTEQKNLNRTTCSPSNVPSAGAFILKCLNCNHIFNEACFDTHVCEYDEHQNIIEQPLISVPITNNDQEKESVALAEPDFITNLRHKQLRIRDFLKRTMHYDVKETSTNAVGAKKQQKGHHKCTLCERVFVYAGGLARHLDMHVQGKIRSAGKGTKGSANGPLVVIKCIVCGCIFFEPTTAQQHLLAHFSADAVEEMEVDDPAEIPCEKYMEDIIKFVNSECHSAAGSNSSPWNQDTPYQFVKTVTVDYFLQCEFCDYIFADIFFLLVHSACHSLERRFECFSCNIHVSTLKDIRNHWQKECVVMRANLKMHRPKQRYFLCNVCERKFPTLDQLHNHRYSLFHFFPFLDNTLGELKLPCVHCDTVSETIQQCVSHYEENHRKQKRGKAKSSDGARNYLCEFCGKVYLQCSHLRQHLKFHEDIKPFVCATTGCTRQFTLCADFEDHVRKCHTGERPYKCLVCTKGFLTASVFYQHCIIHRGERRYKCEECDKSFYRSDALKNHQRIHTGEKPFACDVCTKTFRQRGDRNKHYRVRHSQLDVEGRMLIQNQKMELEAASKEPQSK